MNGRLGDRPRLLLLSHVLPFPGNAGQQQRVFYTLRAAREKFHVTFATVVGREAPQVREKLLPLCDDVVLLPSVYRRNAASRVFHRAAGSVYACATGLKRSNYDIGQVEFHPSRIAALLESRRFDCVLFEYWHAAASTSVCRQHHIPCVLDMHDVLWRSFSHALESRSALLAPWKRWAIRRYRAQEEQAWSLFDAVVAINREEERLVRSLVDEQVHVFHAGMGADLERWPYSPAPAAPPRIAYYGSLATAQSRHIALRCATAIMPEIWKERPDVELWLVGNNPPAFLRRLESDRRVHVTGYVEEVQAVLRTMSAVLCPWSGQFGFRSRLIEVMGLGVPVVATPDAVDGMELTAGKGLLLGQTDRELAAETVRLLNNPGLARDQGRLARLEVERGFSIEKTYGSLIVDLHEWLRLRDARPQHRYATLHSLPNPAQEIA